MTGAPSTSPLTRAEIASQPGRDADSPGFLARSVVLDAREDLR